MTQFQFQRKVNFGWSLKLAADVNKSFNLLSATGQRNNFARKVQSRDFMSTMPWMSGPKIVEELWLSQKLSWC